VELAEQLRLAVYRQVAAVVVALVQILEELECLAVAVAVVTQVVAVLLAEKVF
jgi:hypothetical protein